MLLVPSGILAGGTKPGEEKSSDSVFTQAKLWVWVVSGWGGGGFGFGADSYIWAVAGGSVGVKLGEIYLVEGGGSWLFGTSGLAFELFLRESNSCCWMAGAVVVGDGSLGCPPSSATGMSVSVTKRMDVRFPKGTIA
jgi:hypothetical protein